MGNSPLKEEPFNLSCAILGGREGSALTLQLDSVNAIVTRTNQLRMRYLPGRGSMLVTMQNSELISKLVTIADGNIELVQKAIRAAAGPASAADLEKVVQYILAKRTERKIHIPERVAQVA
jgi:hypothetical protein